MFLANFRHRVTDSADKMNFVETWGSRALEQGDYFGSETFSERTKKFLYPNFDLTNIFTYCVEFNINILWINFILML